MPPKKKNIIEPEKPNEMFQVRAEIKTGHARDDFVEFIKEGYLYVDKTMFIKEVIDDSNHLLITCPRRWGKSLNLTMLKHFLNPQVDNNGELRTQVTNNFKSLEIDNSPQFYVSQIIRDLMIYEQEVRDNDRETMDYVIDFALSHKNCISLSEIDHLLKQRKTNSDYNLEDFQIVLQAVNKHIQNNLKNKFDLEVMGLVNYYRTASEAKKEAEKANDIQKLKEYIGKETEAYNLLKHKIENTITLRDDIKKEYSLTTMNQGKYPVIYLNFKEVAGKTLDVIKEGIKTQIAQSFGKHAYLWDFLEKQEKDKRLTERFRTKAQEEKNQFRRIFLANGKNATPQDIENSLTFLSKLLHNHFGKKVYILIDEYDRAVNTLFEEDVLKEKNGTKREVILTTVKDVSRFISSIISPCVKGAESIYVQKVVLTGIYNTLLKEAGSGVNNIVEYGIRDQKYSKYFGFSQEEIESQVLLKAFQGGKDEDRGKVLSTMKEWYNGQLLGEIEAFTPSSIMSYINDLKTDIDTPPKQYWSNMGSSAILNNIQNLSPSLREKLTTLSMTNDVELSFENHTSLYDFFKDPSANGENQEKMVAYLLIKSGYVSGIKGKVGSFKIPSKELQFVYDETLVKPWLKKILGIKEDKGLVSLVIDLFSAFGKKQSYENFIQKEIVDKINARIQSKEIVDFKEADFQVLLGGLFNLALLSNQQDASYLLYSERMNAIGKRLDGLFIPIKNKSNIAIIHEYKAIEASKNDAKEAKLENAAWQIYAKRYLEVLLSLIDSSQDYQHIKRIYTRPIAFFKDRKRSKWSFEMEEYQHNLEEACSIDKYFQEQIESKGNTENQNEFMNRLSGIGARTLVNEARKSLSGSKKTSKLADLINEIITHKTINSHQRRSGGSPATKGNKQKGKQTKKPGRIAGSGTGLSDEEVRGKLLEYSDELRRRDKIILKTEILNIPGVLQEIGKWHYNRFNTGFISMVKLHDTQEDSDHAVLVYGARENLARNAGVKLQIVDPFNLSTARKYFDDERMELIRSLEDGQGLFGNLAGEVKTEVNLKFLGNQSIDESNCVELCLNETRKEVMHSRMQEIANSTTNTIVLMATDAIDNSYTRDKIQEEVLSFHRSRNARYKIILPLLNDDKWHIMLIDIQRDKQIIQVWHYGNTALPENHRKNTFERFVKENLQFALEEASFSKPLVRLMGANGAPIPLKINVPNYSIETKDKYDPAIVNEKQLVDQVYHAITGKYRWPKPVFASTESRSFFGNHNNSQTINKLEPRMEQKQFELPANSFFFGQKTNNFFLKKNVVTHLPADSFNPFLIQKGLENQERKSFLGLTRFDETQTKPNFFG